MKTLVLNAGYEPLAVVSFKRAIVLVMNHKATVLESDRDHPVWSIAGSWDRPSVILLTRYVRIPHGRAVPVSRRGVLRRDLHRCAYCGKSATTIDHVLPRSRGGRDSWENLVACCLRCNNVKSDKTPAEMGWMLSFTPMPPMTPPGSCAEPRAPSQNGRATSLPPREDGAAIGGSGCAR